MKHESGPTATTYDEPLVPHGFSVIVTAPAAFRFTYGGDRDKHHKVAELLTGAPVADGDGRRCPTRSSRSCRTWARRAASASCGYGEDDIDALVAAR